MASTSKIKEWVQREWRTPGVSLFREPGDFGNLYNLMPEADRRQLKRSPAWYGPLPYPDDFNRPRNVFHDRANDCYVAIGQLVSNDYLASCYMDSWMNVYGPYALIEDVLSLGGRSGQNVVYWGGYLYLISSDSQVWRGASYTDPLNPFYTVCDAWILVPVGDNLFLITTTGKILRLNSDESAFEAHYSPIPELHITWATSFRGSLTLFALGDDGTLFMYRVGDHNPTALHQIAHMPSETGEYNTTTGVLFCAHDDKIYFCPGYYSTVGVENLKTLDIYAFNGSQVERVARLENIYGYHAGPEATPDPFSIGMTHWRGELVLYILYDTLTSQVLKLLAGKQFVDFAPLTTELPAGYIADVYSLGGELAIPTVTEGLEGFHFLVGAANGYLTTTWLDMGSPGLIKRLHRLSALLDSAAENFDVVIQYRIDGASDWTTAATCENTIRATAELAIDFFTLQIKIELDDNTEAGNQDVRIEAISAVYSVDD